MKKVKIAVIGVKGVGKYHLKLIIQHDKAELIAICDIDKDSMNEYSNLLDVKKYTDYQIMISENSLDAVFICTPHNLHFNIAKYCLESAINVFIEKPLANTVKEADELIRTAEEKNLALCVGHQYRSHRSSQIMKNMIESGRIGNLMRILWSWSSFRPEIYYENKPWHATWQESGAGVLMNQVSHDIDLICWLAGKPIEVCAMMGNQIHNAEIEDIACANILFENGVFGSFQFTINQPEAFSIRQVVGDRGAIFFEDVKSLTDDMDDKIIYCKYEKDVNEMVKEKWNQKKYLQTARLENTKKKKVKLNLKNRIKTRILSVINNRINPPQKPDWMKWDNPTERKAILNNFIESVLNGSSPMVDGRSTLNTIEVINAIILSAFSKKTVQIPVDRDEYQKLYEHLCAGKETVARYRN